MAKNFIIALLFLLFVGSATCLLVWSDDIEEAQRKRNRDYMYVDFVAKCECGNDLWFEAPYPPDLWPLEVTCAVCNIKYSKKVRVLINLFYIFRLAIA